VIYDRSNVKEQVNFILRGLSGSIDALYTASNLLTITNILENMRVDVQNLIYLNEIRDKQTLYSAASENIQESGNVNTDKQVSVESEEQNPAAHKEGTSEIKEVSGNQYIEKIEECKENADSESNNNQSVSELDRLVAELIGENEDGESNKTMH